jgi:2,3-bisphosphoglycerate-dependent phosphoglycerate mutase
MKKIIFIRHGKAAMAGQDHERELDEDGIIQANSLKKKLIELGLKNTKVYSSPFKRAVQTIEPFLSEKNGNKAIITTDLEEIHMPKDEKLSKHQIIEKMWEDELFKVGNGISHSEHFNKIKPFLDEVFNKFKSENEDIIMITHGVLIGIILKFFFDIEFGFNDWKKMTMPDIYMLSFDKDNNFIEMKRDNNNIERIFSI